MERKDVQEWLNRYIVAWRQNDEDLIAALFSDNAVYHFAPWGAEHTARGVEEIVSAWMDDRDEPDSWEAQYTVFVVDGDLAVATGTSRYVETDDRASQLFHNCYLMRFAPDGRCSEFTEYYMLEK